jgi:hypothetical protein
MGNSAFTKEQRDILTAYIPGHHMNEIQQFIQEQFRVTYSLKQVGAYCQNHKVRTGFSGQFGKERSPVPYSPFKPGKHISPATEFKKGQASIKTLPIGTRRDKKDGVTWVKVSNVGSHRWRMEKTLVWEKANGPIPDGAVIKLIDGNPKNIAPDNLMLMTKAEVLRYNRRGFNTTNQTINRAALNLAKLDVRAINAKKQNDSE